MSETRLRILVVDDEASIRDMLKTRFEIDGHSVETVGTGERALAALTERAYDVAFVDVNLGGGMSGLDFLKQVPAEASDLTVIMISAHGSIATAVEATKLGAFDFLEKPFNDERLDLILRHLAERAGLQRRARAAALGGAGLAMIGRSEGLRKLQREIDRVAPTQGKVLITGENGSGKDLVARAIHLGSRRADATFVKLNCAAIPRDLVESELFGYEKGAFTGAMQAKKGKLELAHGGTLFLDEIGDLNLEAQAKLLRAIETGEVERVGGTRTSTVDVRIVSATHKDLPNAVRDGTFREDLYFRLNVLPIHVPPLRERKEDVRPLAEHFVQEFAQAEGLSEKQLAEDALAMLEGYSWPGNVRELRNLMERAVILVNGPVIRAADLADWLVPVTRARAGEGTAGGGGAGGIASGAGSPGGASAGMAGAGARGGSEGEAPGALAADAGDLSAEGPATLREEMERREAEAIVKVLEDVRWNVTQAAAQLGVDRTNLHRKMRKYGIRRSEKEENA
ncbi:MAG: sigma-54-dependent transcriptional regulator [Candidatus Eiseniibacteriota bacterium]